jgi:TonB-dependent receptor
MVETTVTLGRTTRWLAGCSLAAFLSMAAAGAAQAQTSDAVPDPAAVPPAAPAGGDPQTAPGIARPSSGTVAPSGDQGVSAGAPNDQTSGEEVIVTGIRASLRSAQQIKRNAPQIVDSVVAEDIGKLPDRNVADALQRITGIQVNKQYGEGSTVAIRGLSQVRTELNGHDIFTAGNTSQLTLEDIPSELLAGIDVYKNPSADLIEGQLSGTINFRTRKPFDFDGFKISAAVGNTYYDLAKKTKPLASILVSDRWETPIGEIGVLANVNYQKTAFRQDTISTEPFYTLDPTNAVDAATLASLGRTGKVTTLPHGTGIGDVFGSRSRLGIDGSVQWRPSDTLEFTGEIFRNDYKFRYADYSYFAYTSGASITPLAGAPFTYADNGDFVSGAFSNLPIGANTSLDVRHTVTTDYTGTVKWKPTSRLTVSGDFQYIKGTTNFTRSIFGLNGTATSLTQDISGAVPAFSVTSANGLDDRSTYDQGAFYLDDLSHTKAVEKAARADAEYKFDGVLQSLKAGFRFNNRTNATEDTGYRYVQIAGAGGAIPATIPVSFRDFFHGQADVIDDASLAPLSSLTNYGRTLSLLGLQAPTFQPSGFNAQQEKTYAGYVVGFFNADRLPVPVDGNVGVRLVHTSSTASGFYQQFDLVTNPDGTQATSTTPLNNEISFGRKYTYALPSVNLRGKFTDNLQLRLAFSKNLFRPGFDQLNPTLSITEPGAAQLNQEHDVSGGNPELKPVRSTNYDASLEWYFAKSGSVSAAGFYKDVKDFIQTGITPRQVTFSDGVTTTYQVTSFSNVASAKIKGFEVAYQQFADFLPGALKGLGLQANFTYVDSKAPSPATAGPVTQVPLEQLSKYSYNLVGIYEYGKLSMRLAYNWRSKYLVTTNGNGSGNLPVFNKAFGQVDGNITYNFTDKFSLTLAVVNLTNARHDTYYGLVTRPRDSIVYDRQVSGIARITF